MAPTAEFTREAREEIAYALLEGRGDPEAGEWIEDRPQAFHLRRRLSSTEAAQLPGGGELRDIRGTWEAKKRLDAVRRYLPAGYSE